MRNCRFNRTVKSVQMLAPLVHGPSIGLFREEKKGNERKKISHPSNRHPRLPPPQSQHRRRLARALPPKAHPHPRGPESLRSQRRSPPPSTATRAASCRWFRWPTAARWIFVARFLFLPFHSSGQEARGLGLWRWSPVPPARSRPPLRSPLPASSPGSSPSTGKPASFPRSSGPSTDIGVQEKK
ncbi:hypothetical protein BRADI_1g29506v3 [Brachypodium distachyon]|uniref:Uncharacterized protein n=1 Tax=Brachypodium distachyon TaxID=15368 RepID=A0A0Q3KZQ8_BRADI|nr:hypothetical protein BRADI_1g29506v3 [Brachypodium distachyon]PNT75281.1 hypothetical protein BRADI_1g29506v3 [Brachypodium distachyon]PNT75282.1 hypothetical protein BRADI_1g29506v3 [Brachypodium distachyon]PNT75283.1 hypothetical protein BRADI_1g29506v3 [Brachypodium distachyon]PNT75284.1 hypothetical protein BRADI_1g29506v3 [Brachypodium distachyon]